MACSVGSSLNEDCDGAISTSDVLSEKNNDLIRLRSGVQFSSVCAKHRTEFLHHYFVRFGPNCCNPLAREHPDRGADLKEISYGMYRKWSHFRTVPGKRVCRACRDLLNKMLTPPTSEVLVPPEPTPLEIMEVIYGHQALPDLDDITISPPALTPQISPRVQPASAPLQSPRVLALKEEDNGSESSQSHSEASGSKPSSQDFWTTPVEMKAWEKIKNIATILGVPVPASGRINSMNKLTLLQVEMQSALKSLLYEAAKLERKYTAADNPLKVPIDYEDTCIEIFSQIKDKLWNSKSIEEKIHLLSLAPKSWSWYHLREEFEVGRKLAQKAKTLVAEQGILPLVNPRVGTRTIDDAVIKKVKDFYRRQDISREMPGKKDVKSVREDGDRVLKQKRLFLCTLREGYEAFKADDPDCEIGFSKFACLRPKEVTLAGASGTHAVCVCTTHQNMKLMIFGARLDKLKDVKINGHDLEDLTYHAILEKIHCSPPTEDCHLQECPKCPGPVALQELLRSIFEERMVQKIEYKQWTATDRAKLITVVQSTEEFIDTLLEALPPLSVHSYVSKQQSKFFKEKKESLKPGEVLVVGDFSENYSFVIQEAVQGYHWTNDQATLHPFMAYYRPSADEEVVGLSLVVLSDYMKHNTNAVHSFQNVLIDFLKQKIENIIMIYYFSDGAAGQYKNKYNAANLLKHEEDFGIRAEWNFFATSHGKGPSDGLGGSFKRQATLASLRAAAGKGNYITTVKELYDWAQSSLEMAVSFVDKEIVLNNILKLQERFMSAAPVPSIRKQHCLVPMAENLMSIARDSYGAGYQVVDLSPVEKKSETRARAKNDNPDDPDETAQAERSHTQKHPSSSKSQTKVSQAAGPSQPRQSVKSKAGSRASGSNTKSSQEGPAPKRSRMP